jgi:hypothetical protein
LKKEKDAPIGETTRIIARVAVIFPLLMFVLMGLIQLFAVYAEIESVTHIWKIAALYLASIITYIPIIGNVCGFFGAKNVWDWPWRRAAALYIGLPVFMLLISVVISAIGRKASSVTKSK